MNFICSVEYHLIILKYIYECDLFELFFFFFLPILHLLLVWPQGHLLVTNDTWWCFNSYGDEVNTCV